ncbi:MAG: hypothetical protein JRI95_05415 [Deltaproteobacteria bacterium]|nr:hypothetical protein [Deltaproteobacteria bacterium]
MAGLRMSIPYGADGIAAVMIECVRLSGLCKAYVDIMCTRGFPPSGLMTRDPSRALNRFMAFAMPFVWIVSKEVMERGAHLIISRGKRNNPGINLSGLADKTVKIT